MEQSTNAPQQTGLDTIIAEKKSKHDARPARLPRPSMRLIELKPTDGNDPPRVHTYTFNRQRPKPPRSWLRPSEPAKPAMPSPPLFSLPPTHLRRAPALLVVAMAAAGAAAALLMAAPGAAAAAAATSTPSGSSKGGGRVFLTNGVLGLAFASYLSYRGRRKRSLSRSGAMAVRGASP